MRTIVNLDEHLLLQAKEYAAKTGLTLADVIEGALREMFARQKIGNQNRDLNLTAVSGQGLQPGVDLDDSAMLLDLMDES